MAANLQDFVTESLRTAALAADTGNTHDRGDREPRVVPLASVWHDLGTSRALVVDSFCRPERCYLVTRSRAPITPVRGITARNLQILTLALLARMQKNVALDLGITQSAVAFAASRCLRAMGLDCTASTAPALLVAAVQAYHQEGAQPLARAATFVHGGFDHHVFSIRRPEPRGEGLSDAERDIVRLIIERRTNLEIAQLRATSKRTVANQLSRILAKLGVDGRLGVVQQMIVANA